MSTDNSTWRHEGDFRLWILSTTGATRTFHSMPRYKGKQLVKLKTVVTNWQKPDFTIHKAIFYDKRVLDSEGQPKEIARYQDGQFLGV